MEIFLKKISLFLFLLLAIMAPFVYANKTAMNRKLASDAFRLAPDQDTLIVGDSHGQTSVDPALLPGTVNLSASGESIFYTYYKLRHFIRRNPNTVHNVVLAFSYHNIAKKYQEDYLFEDVKSAFSFERYYIYLDNAGKKILTDSNNFVTYSLKYDLGIPLMEYKESGKLRFLFTKPDKTRIDEFGGFRTSGVAKVDTRKVPEKIKLYFYDRSKYAGCSPVMVASLENIASLCAQEGIKLYLYNAPLHAAYQRQVPSVAYDDYDRVVAALKLHYPGVVVLDLSRIPLDDYSFKDGDHVNEAGAKVATNTLYSQLRDSGNHPESHQQSLVNSFNVERGTAYATLK